MNSDIKVPLNFSSVVIILMLLPPPPSLSLSLYLSISLCLSLSMFVCLSVCLSVSLSLSLSLYIYIYTCTQVLYFVDLCISSFLLCAGRMNADIMNRWMLKCADKLLKDYTYTFTYVYIADVIVRNIKSDICTMNMADIVINPIDLS